MPSWTPTAWAASSSKLAGNTPRHSKTAWSAGLSTEYDQSIVARRV